MIQLINLLQNVLKNFHFKNIDIRINKINYYKNLKIIKILNIRKYEELLRFNDSQIIKIYSDSILRFLLYYRTVSNFETVKKIIFYLHKIFILVLAKKHKKSKA